MKKWNFHEIIPSYLPSERTLMKTLKEVEGKRRTMEDEENEETSEEKETGESRAKRNKHEEEGKSDRQWRQERGW